MTSERRRGGGEGDDNPTRGPPDGGAKNQTVLVSIDAPSLRPKRKTPAEWHREWALGLGRPRPSLGDPGLHGRRGRGNDTPELWRVARLGNVVPAVGRCPSARARAGPEGGGQRRVQSRPRGGGSELWVMAELGEERHRQNKNTVWFSSPGMCSWGKPHKRPGAEPRNHDQCLAISIREGTQ